MKTVIPFIRIGDECSCGKGKVHIFRGRQETLDPNNKMNLYNCSACGSTRAPFVLVHRLPEKDKSFDNDSHRNYSDAEEESILRLAEYFLGDN